MTAKTPNERQQAFKQRQQEVGLKEVRNLWALPKHHERIKAFALALQREAFTTADTERISTQQGSGPSAS